MARGATSDAGAQPAERLAAKRWAVTAFISLSVMICWAPGEAPLPVKRPAIVLVVVLLVVLVSGALRGPVSEPFSPFIVSGLFTVGAVLMGVSVALVRRRDSAGRSTKDEG